MTTFTKILLSGSTNGRNIEIAATGTPGTLVHTAVSGTSSLDEIYLFAVNTSASTVTLTIEFGGVTSSDDLIEIDLEAGKGAYLVIPGWLLQNALVVRAFAGTANVVNINGYAHRIV